MGINWIEWIIIDFIEVKNKFQFRFEKKEINEKIEKKI